MLKKTILPLLLLFAVTVASAAQYKEERASYLAMEANTGRVLFSSNAEAVRPISCLSQVATALVALDWMERRNVNLDQLITVPNAVQAITKTNPLDLRPGDRMTLRDAIVSTVLWADSASAYSVAYHVGSDLYRQYGGSDPIAVFVGQMNALAVGLGMKKTSFVSPHGLEMNGHTSRSCAVDLALLGMYAMQNKAFTFIASQAMRRCTVMRPTGPQAVTVKNANQLLSMAGVDGIKTANSKAAGPSLMVSVTRPSVSRINPRSGREEKYPQRLIVIILGMRENDSNYRFIFASDMIKAAWPMWDRWQKSGDFKDQKDFIFFPKKPALLVK